MTLKYHPKNGLVLMCDFTLGFRKPELIKKRPVIVVANGGKHNTGLVTVVGLSTTEPSPVRAYHCRIDNKKLPKTSLFQNKSTWVKGDMIYTVGFHRLSLVGLGRVQGKRQYYTACLSRDSMVEIYTCVLNGLNLGELSQHL